MQSKIHRLIFNQAIFRHIITPKVKKDNEKEWAKIDEVTERVVNKAISLGGTSTGEHGVGIGKRKFMDKEHGAGLKWMKRIKDLFDPNGILNPGKIFFDSEDAL